MRERQTSYNKSVREHKLYSTYKLLPMFTSYRCLHSLLDSPSFAISITNFPN